MELLNLIKFRENLGFNQKDFASELGIKQTTYNGYEKGKSDPGTDFFVMIAKKYNVSIDYLLGRSTYPEIETNEDAEHISEKAISVAVAYDKATEKNKLIVRVALDMEGK